MSPRTIAALIACLLWATRAQSQDASTLLRAKELFQAGAAAYGAGDYLAAIQAMQSAYALTPLPAIAFSLAQAERRQYFVSHDIEHLERAIELYRQYVERSPNGTRRAEALEALSQLEPLQVVRARSNPSQPAESSAPRTRILITSDTPGARVSLDDSPQGKSPLIREVKPGRHAVEIAAPGYYATRREVTAVEGELIPLDLALEARPATLYLHAPIDAEIYLDGAFLSWGADATKLVFPAGSHDIVVAQKGHRSWARRYKLIPGQVQADRATLELTTQRYTSRALFIVGGAALGSSLILSALAKRAQNAADQYLVTQSRRNVSASELSQYADSVSERNRWRAASIVSLTSSGVLFIAGFLLHELDTPRGSDPHHRSAPSKRSASASLAETPRLRIVPQVTGPTGVWVQGEF